MTPRHVLPAALLLAACGARTAPAPSEAAPTAAEAQAFVQRADAALREAWTRAEQANWAYETDLTDAHAAAVTEATAASMATTSALVREAARYRNVTGLAPEVQRQLDLLRRGTHVPAPSDPGERARMAQVLTELSGMYGRGEHCGADGVCRDLGELEAVLAAGPTLPDPSAAAAAQLDAWVGWRTVSPPMRPLYAEFVRLGNEGARELGFDDMGTLWRSGYDMTPEAFDAEVERLWQEVRPLYEQLHCHVRAGLTARYGADVVPPDGPIPAHLLGNMWAQEWGHLHPLVAPSPDAADLDVTAAMQAQGWDVDRMFRVSEGFFTSLGLDPLPSTFWERSMLVQPPDREVVCHASAWDPAYAGDLRVKMCTRVTQGDLVTIHHELGHLYYFQAYHQLPVLLQNGANDGFHEAIGDAIALSITPGYLHDLGLLDAPDASEAGVLDAQMRRALGKVAFLPFGRMIDLWRWGVFSGEIPEDRWNAAWWELRERYQGVAAPVPRTEAHFDPGAKYHIPGNTPYMRYFLAAILQFQLHEALCRAAGHEGPLHTCSIFGSEAAGERLQAMLALGASRPWPDALEVVTGTREMSAAPMLAYFAPLRAWLEEANAGRSCGW